MGIAFFIVIGGISEYLGFREKKDKQTKSLKEKQTKGKQTKRQVN